MRVSVGRSCCNVESRHATLKCSKVERQTNVYKKQILQESLSRSFFVIIFTHFETLLMVFTLIVPLSVMMREYPNVLHLFLTSKRNFLVSKESDSFINIEFSLLNPRSLVFLSFRLYLLAKRASHDSLSINFTMMSPFFVLCDTSILVFLISLDVFGTFHTEYRCSSHIVPKIFERFQASPSSHIVQAGFS